MTLWLAGVVACILVLASASGCRRAEGARSSSGAPGSATDERQLPLPAVPDSIADPAARADFLITHFWDGLDFTGLTEEADSVFIEQSFSNFVSLLPLGSNEAMEEGVWRLMRRASQASGAIEGFMLRLAEKYLWEADSPFRSDRSFLPFLDYQLSRGAVHAERASALKELLLANAPGTQASDVRLLTRHGDWTQLLGDNGGRRRLLMFYEHDCDQCDEAIRRLSFSTGLASAIEAGELSFTAVDLSNDSDAWREHARTMPLAWTVTADINGDIDRLDLYQVRATPSFYLVDTDNRIVLKDEPVSVIEHMFRPN